MERPMCLDPNESHKLSFLYFRKETYSVCVCCAKLQMGMCTCLRAGAKRSFSYKNSSVENFGLKSRKWITGKLLTGLKAECAQRDSA